MKNQNSNSRITHSGIGKLKERYRLPLILVSTVWRFPQYLRHPPERNSCKNKLDKGKLSEGYWPPKRTFRLSGHSGIGKPKER